LENPPSRAFLIRRLLHENGVEDWRRLLIDDLPTNLPWTTPAASETTAGSTWAPQVTAPRDHRTGYVSVLDYHQAYRSGASTPEQVAQQVLTAIADSEARTPPLRAFIACDHDDVHRQAEASSQRWRMGQPWGPFDGVPVAVKDDLDQLPYATTLGTCFITQRLTAQEATVVTRLRAAGALLLGKTTLPEFALGVTGTNPHHGAVCNPYQPAYTSGGSSAGTAAAVAAGLCPVAFGSDGSGSIRTPAALCGIVGLKPTQGRVSGFGTLGYGCSVCQVGPLAATVWDAALAYALIAGPDPQDPTTLQQPPLALAGIEEPDLHGLTLGVYRPWFEHAAPALVAGAESLLNYFQERGARVSAITLPDLNAGQIAQLVILLAEFAAFMERYAAYRRHFSLELRCLLTLAESLTARDYLKAQRFRTRLSTHFQRAFQDVDVILTPTTGCTAPPIHPDALQYGELNLGMVAELIRFTPLANLTGLPAITFPAGYDPQGLPLGCQAIGRPWQEAVLLRLAQVAETQVEHHLPSLYYRVLPAA
jgi:Asp-tRNA(Asn)/Glu-tRNA(Gln) amidotransferase A subunit family amidase